MDPVMKERTHDEFTCTDCDQLIYSVPPHDPPPTVCATCQWLNEFISDLVEREVVRARLQGEEP